jgi:hypothetical protein
MRTSKEKSKRFFDPPEWAGISLAGASVLFAGPRFILR